MGFFESIRSLMNNQPVEDLHWTIPKDTDEIDAIFKNIGKPQLFYKHSYRCGTSIFTKRSLDSGIKNIKKHADVYLIDVTAMCEISQYISKKSGVRHESPQIVLLHKGQPIWHESHGGVQLENIKAVFKELNAG